MPHMEHNPLTASDVAALLAAAPGGGPSTRTVNRWCRAGKVTTVGKLGGETGAYLIGPEGVEQARKLWRPATVPAVAGS